MKRFARYLITFFAIIFAVSTGMSVYYLRDLGKQPGKISSFQKRKQPPIYHFAIIVNNLDTPFWQTFKKGVLEAAEEYNVAVEINGVGGVEDIDESIRYLDMAIASRVDGVITYVLKKEVFASYIDKAEDKGIPVITVESDAQGSARRCFVGTNDFELGKKAGEMMATATKGKAKIAIILQSYVDDEYDVSNNLKIEGFKDVIKEYKNMEVITVKASNLGIFSAEDITQDIITNYPEINAIFCTSSKDTIGATQVIIDFNKVGDITIIGYDDLPDILNYIEKEVVYGTVVRDPKTMGYESIRSLVDLKRGQPISASITTDVDIVTKANVKQYKRMMGLQEQGVSQ